MDSRGYFIEKNGNELGELIWAIGKIKDENENQYYYVEVYVYHDTESPRGRLYYLNYVPKYSTLFLGESEDSAEYRTLFKWEELIDLMNMPIEYNNPCDMFFMQLKRLKGK